MAIQDDTGYISLDTPSDMDMDSLGDISSDFRMGILFFSDHENDSEKQTEAQLHATFTNSPTSMISDLFNYAAQHGLLFQVMIPLPPRISNRPLSLNIIHHDSVRS